MKIEIGNTEVNERTVTSQKGDFTVREQEAFLHDPKVKYPTRFTVQLGKDTSAFQPGIYQLTESSFYVNRFGQLSLKRELALEAANEE
jgi:hypothetical protein